MCITCNVKVKGLCWLKVALHLVKEQTITYFVAAVLQNTRKSCDEISPGGFRWISLGTFLPNYESFVSFSLLFLVAFTLSYFEWRYKSLFALMSHQVSLGLLYFGTGGTRFTESTDIERSPVTAQRKSLLDQAGLTVCVRLSCGRAGGNLKVLWKTKSGPAAAASCWPTLFRGSRYRLMTELLLSGPHY